MDLPPIALSLPSRQLSGIADQISETINDVVASGWWLKGQQTNAFEEEFAAYCGVPFCLGVANGTDGLELALRSVGAANHEVITVANAGGYTTTACRLVGATPSYVDIDPALLTLDINAAIAAVTPQTRAVVATHLFGNVVDVTALRSGLVAIGRGDILIVEDGSQAHGARLGNKTIGSLGDIAVFSFYPTKNLGALGDAGAVVCQDAGLYDQIEALHQYGWTERYQSKVPFGRNSRMDEIQAAVLRVKLPHLDGWNAQRKTIAETYLGAVAGCGGRLVNDLDSGAVVHLAVARTLQRDPLRNHLSVRRIQSGVHFPVLDCDQESQRGMPVVSDGLDESRRAREEILTVPCFPGMTSEEVDRVAEALGSYRPEGKDV